jgi:hypothetical protein
MGISQRKVRRRPQLRRTSQARPSSGPLFAFFNEFEGKKPPEECEKGAYDPAKSKAELIRYLKDSFDYLNRSLQPELFEIRAHQTNQIFCEFHGGHWALFVAHHV